MAEHQSQFHLSSMCRVLQVQRSGYYAWRNILRDYIHVMDLAEGHLLACQKNHGRQGFHTYNLGRGQPLSVLDMLHAFELACGRPLPHVIKPRRAGDMAAYWADPTKALAELGWQASRDVNEMCADTWRWQSSNPQGYLP